MGSIQEMFFKIKGIVVVPSSDLLIVLIIVLVGSAGFGLGRLSALESGKAPVSIIEPAQTTAAAGAAVQSGGGEVVASKNGTKYHFPWCAGAQQIAEKNKIAFASTEEARKAGYTPAANCKGLE